MYSVFTFRCYWTPWTKNWVLMRITRVVSWNLWTNRWNTKQNSGSSNIFSLILENDRFFDSGGKWEHRFHFRHYAGDVVYNINGFLEKNRDTLFQDFKRLLYSSRSPVISNMWPEGAVDITKVSDYSANLLLDKILELHFSNIKTRMYEAGK